MMHGSRMPAFSSSEINLALEDYYKICIQKHRKGLNIFLLFFVIIIILTFYCVRAHAKYSANDLILM